MQKLRQTEKGNEMKTLFFDTETTGVQDLYNKTPREQFRLGQWCWGRDGEVFITEDYDVMLEQIGEAELLIAHNIFYDLTVMFGKGSTRPLELALEKRLLDTFWWYPLRNRIPAKYVTADGRNATTYSDGKQKPELVKKFLKLGNVTSHHDLSGKEGDLVALAKEFNPPKTLNSNLDFGLIPTSDERYRAYAIQDIVALRGLASFLLDQGPITDHEWKEMLVAAINDQMSKNGIRVDKEAASTRYQELLDQNAKTMEWLVEEFDFPTAGVAPWKSNPGKEAILKAFKVHGFEPGVTEDWILTPKGAPSFAGKVLMSFTEGTEAEKLGSALAGLQSFRPLSKLALESCWEDGYAHPSITALQRSGRFSMTNPSLPIWTARGDNAVEKKYFLASPGHKLVEMDYSNADQRIVAALSGDENYAKRFQPDPITGEVPDGHELSGRLMFGDEVYDSDPAHHRNISKALSHAFAYGAGAKTLARTSKLPDSDDPDKDPLKLAYRFIDAMNEAYPWNKAWRQKAAKDGESGQLVNEWGRTLFVDVDRSWTQSPGLLGQSGTRAIMCDGLMAIAFDKPEVLLWLVATVHDAVVWDIPEGDLGWAVDYIKGKMEKTFTPSGPMGQPIDFTMTVGTPSDNWFESGH